MAAAVFETISDPWRPRSEEWLSRGPSKYAGRENRPVLIGVAVVVPFAGGRSEADELFAALATLYESASRMKPEWREVWLARTNTRSFLLW